MMSENHHIFRQKHQIKIFSYHGFYLKKKQTWFGFLDSFICSPNLHWPQACETKVISSYTLLNSFHCLGNKTDKWYLSSWENISFYDIDYPENRIEWIMNNGHRSVQVNEGHSHRSVIFPGKRSSWSWRLWS